MLRHAVRRQKATVMAAVENGQLLGFTVLIPYHDMVMVDYLAVSSKIRSNGTGSRLLQNTVMAAVENGQLLGFTVLIPYHDMVMVDYLAVSSKIRSNGTGSRLLQNILKQFPDKKIVLLIERPDDTADNKEQRIARRRFYLKNSFVSSDIFITGASGDMEKKIVLLIERPDDTADNKEQRIARRRFYLKNSFVSSDIFITGASGDMEVLVCGGTVSREEYIDMQRYALGDMFFRLSHIRIAEG